MVNRYNFKEIEENVLGFWKKNQTYVKSSKRNTGKQKFYFLQGPPYTSGKIHIGHAWNNSMKDIILRFKRMQGLDVWDRAGYDMHGLPTANKVQKKLGLKTKEDIVKYGIGKFTKECQKFSEENAKQMDTDLQRLGIWMDYENAYLPIRNKFIEGEWLFIKKAYETDRLYKGKKVMTWCKDCETALAKHELEYENVTDSSIFLKFKVKDKDNTFLIIWTTTPWTIPFNLGVMAGPEIDYVRVDVEGEKFILAKDLADSVVKETFGKDYTIEEEFKGKDLEGLKYEHPFDISAFSEIQSDALHSVVLSDEYVDTSAGSGLVHMAPGCGPEDQEVGARNGLPAFNRINEQGVFEDMDQFNAMTAKTDDKKFIEMFENNGCLVATKQVKHEYPHCWRCHNGVVFRTTEQWFLRTEDLRKEILKYNADVNWVPDESNKSFILWNENLKDNAITRQRFWGCPVPIWQCECGKMQVIGSADELKNKAVGNIPDDFHRPYIDAVKLKCKCGGEMTRIPDVLDVWIDSGTASWNSLEYPSSGEHLNRLFPADLVLEATEQTRLWFTMLQVCSAIVFGKSSYKNVYCHGMILDYQGMKMSKSLGNIISPYEIIDKYGADVLRYYMCQTTAGKNINFSWDTVKLKQRNLNVLWNIQNFILDLDSQLTGQIKPTHRSVEENYILSKLNSTTKKVKDLFNEYRLDETITEIEELFLELSRTYIQMVREKVSMGTDEERKLVLETLKEAMFSIIKMFSVIVPFITEEIYQNLKDIVGTKEESIHLFNWPAANESVIDETLEKHMIAIQGIIQAGLAAREKAQISLRWPIQKIIICSEDPFIEEAVKDMDEILKRQLNVKEIHLNADIDVEFDVKLNYREAGKKLEQNTASVAQALKEVDGTEVYYALKKNGNYKIKVDNSEFELLNEDLEFEKKVDENLKFSEFENGAVYLDIRRDDELLTEGFAREVMRQIQQLRKDKGLNKNDMIDLHIKTDFTNIDLYSEHIKDKCGAKHISISEQESEKDLQGEFKIKDKEFFAYFEVII